MCNGGKEDYAYKDCNYVGTCDSKFLLYHYWIAKNSYLVKYFKNNFFVVMGSITIYLTYCGKEHVQLLAGSRPMI